MFKRCLIYQFTIVIAQCILLASDHVNKVSSAVAKASFSYFFISFFLFSDFQNDFANQLCINIVPKYIC